VIPRKWHITTIAVAMHIRSGVLWRREGIWAITGRSSITRELERKTVRANNTIDDQPDRNVKE
jgi:hypothetical protein